MKLFDEDGHGPIMAERLAVETGLDAARVRAAINALHQADPSYFTGVEGDVNGFPVSAHPREPLDRTSVGGPPEPGPMLSVAPRWWPS